MHDRTTSRPFRDLLHYFHYPKSNSQCYSYNYIYPFMDFPFPSPHNYPSVSSSLPETIPRPSLHSTTTCPPLQQSPSYLWRQLLGAQATPSQTPPPRPTTGPLTQSSSCSLNYSPATRFPQPLCLGAPTSPSEAFQPLVPEARSPAPIPRHPTTTIHTVPDV